MKNLRKVAIRPLSIEERAYIAGFMDGEGYVGCGRCWGGSGMSLTISISQKDRSVLDWIQARTGGRVYRKSVPSSCHALDLHGYEAAVLIRRLFPFLIVKREKAFKSAKMFWETCRVCDRRYHWPPHRTAQTRRRMREHPVDRHKLTPEQRQELRDLYATGRFSTRKLAKMFGIAKSNAAIEVRPLGLKFTRWVRV